MKKILTSIFCFIVLSCPVDARPRGLTAASSAVVLAPSTRSLLNINFADVSFEYMFIDHIVYGGGAQGISPTDQGTFASPGYFHDTANTPWNAAILDSAGYPNNSVADGKNWGNHLYVPSSSDYGADPAHKYTISWDGDCRLAITGTSVIFSNDTLVSGTNYVKNGNGDWSGSNVKLRANYSGAKQQLSWRVSRTGHLGSGAGFCRNIKFMRQDDEADYAAGNIYRSGWKQLIVNMDPSAIRFMNWHGGNNATNTRFEDRAPVGYGTWGGAYTTVSPAYGNTAGTGNSFTVAAVTTGSRQTPASMTHGEIVTARLDHTGVNFTAGGYAITAINKCATGVAPCNTTGQVQTTAAHPFVVGDQVIFATATGAGMTQIHLWNTTVTAVQDSTHFSTGIDTTAFSTFTSGSVAPYVSLDVGGRGAYPVIDQNANPIASDGSVNYLHANDYRTFYFDKTVGSSRDGSGNLILGAWIVRAQSDNGIPIFIPQVLGVPIEVCTRLINELNAMGPRKPIDMWLNIPAPALMSMDPDYTAASNYTYNAVNIVLNGNGSWPALNSQRHLLLEYSNETWNGPSVNFSQYTYVQQRQYARSGTAFGITSYSVSHAIRATVLANDITSGVGTNSRVHYVLAGQGAIGIAGGSTNYIRTFGNAAYYADSTISALPATIKTVNTNSSSTLNGIASTADLTEGMGVSGPGIQAGTQITAVTGANSVTISPNATATASGVSLTFRSTPISYHWGFASGTYFDPPTSTDYLTKAGTGGFTDDSALYNGTAPYSSPDTTTAINNLVAQLVSGVGSNAQSTTFFAGLTTAYSNKFAPLGKYVVNYEGGIELNACPTATCGQTYGGHTVTAADQTFMLATQGSSQWATAQINFFNSFKANSMAVMPAPYVLADIRWGMTSVNNTVPPLFPNPDTYFGGVEGGALNATYNAIVTYNAAQPD